MPPSPHFFPFYLSLLERVFGELKHGHLLVRLPRKGARRYGHSRQGQAGELIIHKPRRFAFEMLRRPTLGFAEAYRLGAWSSPDLPALLSLFVHNYAHIQKHLSANWLGRVASNWANLRKRNSRGGARRNIHAHYDLGNQFYETWLDETMTYSAACFQARPMSLAKAQQNKYQRLIDALDIRPQDRVLEIGCGWGGFAEYASSQIGCHVTGITISKEQLAYAQNRIHKAQLNHKVDLRFQDYRDVEETYDKVVSIEMFEAVGRQYWSTFFEKLRDVTKPNGRCGLQIISVADQFYTDHTKSSGDFIDKYIFPGGALPSPSLLRKHFTQAGLELKKHVAFAQDYARTLRSWRHNFLTRWGVIKTQGFDGRFKNVWDYYLSLCIAGFTNEHINVGQFVLEPNKT